MSQSIVNGLVFGGEISFAPDQISVDAGGILRVGQQTTLFDGKILNADDTYLWQNTGSGSGTYTSNKYNMSVTSGQYQIKQSIRRFPYFSGKSQRVEVTFDGFQAQANVTKRVGYFSSSPSGTYSTVYDGFWLENDGSTIYLKASRLGTETLSVPISSWSGYANLAEYQSVSNWSNFTVVEFKFLWLGGAVLVLSIKNSLGFVEAHRFNYAGTTSDTFISSPNQPVRYEIRSTTGTGSFRYICAQVATEGSIEENGKGLAIFNSTSVNANTIGTIYALIGLKKSPTYRDTGIRIIDLSLARSSSDSGVLMLIINPTLSGALTYANNSKLQVAYATNQTITAGTGRVIAATNVGSLGGGKSLSKDFLSWLSMQINDTPDEYVLAYMPTTTNQVLYGTINVEEY